MGAKKLIVIISILLFMACSGNDYPDKYVLVEGTFAEGTYNIELSMRDSNDVPYPSGFYILYMYAGDYEYRQNVLITSKEYTSSHNYGEPVHLRVMKYGGPEEIFFSLPKESYVVIKLIPIALNDRSVVK